MDRDPDEFSEFHLEFEDESSQINAYQGGQLKNDGFLKRRYCTVITYRDADGPKRKLVKTEQLDAEEPHAQKQQTPNNNQKVQNPSQDQCCKRRYYKKRRYRCPGKRRYKAKPSYRCCHRQNNNNRINLCNRNWARISINPFINFLRCYRKRFNKHTPPSEIAKRGRCEWRRMSCKTKQKYFEQAKRARIRGYRT